MKKIDIIFYFFTGFKSLFDIFDLKKLGFKLLIFKIF